MDSIVITDDDRQTPPDDDRQTPSDDDRQTPPDDDRQTPPDDDRQTPSNDQSSSDDISSVTTEESLPVYEDDQQQSSNMSHIRVCPVKVDNRSSVSNSTIKHPYQADDNDPFNDEKRIIIDEHVKVSHINRADLRSLNRDISLLRLDACLRRRNMGNISVSRINRSISQSINGNINNRETTQITSRESTVRISRISTTSKIKKDSKQKVIASKPMVTRLSLSNEPSFKMKQQEFHVSVKHISVNSNNSL